MTALAPEDMNEPVYFGTLPIWRGPVERYTVPDTAPFVLAVEADTGLIRQTGAWRSEAVAAYAENSYVHLTRLGDESGWGGYLADWQMGYLIKGIDDLASMRSVLDIGSGSVHVAHLLRRTFADAEVTLCDPALKRIEDSEGFALVADYFPTPHLTGRTFDVVTSFNCLEHVGDPSAFLSGIRSVLRPGGRAFLVLPAVERALAVGDPGIFVHEHLSYFTEAALQGLFEASGLAIRSIDRPSGILAVSAEAAESSAPNALGAAAAGALLTAARRRCAENVANAARTIRSRLDGGESVALHGAGNGLNNFLYLSGLLGDLRLTVFDGDETKTGQYLPGHPAPIRNAADPAYRTFDRIYVAASDFFTQIREGAMRRHSIDPERIERLMPEIPPSS
jgi:SAM-dependent methyltransferase